MFRVVTGIALGGSGHKFPTPKSPLRQATYFHTTPVPQPQPRHHKPGQNSAKSNAKPGTNAFYAMTTEQRWVWGALDGAMFVVGLFGGYHLTTFCLEKMIKNGQPRNNRKLGYACMGQAMKEDKSSNKSNAGPCGRNTDSSGPCRSGCQGELCVGSAYPHGVNRWI
ncbi:hypothetical protein CGLO_07025 [Colletotrichum gloeosporioides Cg-14]|uniref:Uncharacterized protein n=1 Tax=Colletotrichum gloeosporioides (strain Cg-14) TaxID=1237896 RepID=T0LNI4_COLGC|nr:hypothetical protein CGLO_07025 [Colletotrichum gloeosporioides Cg-14]